nr:HAD family phosphatase [uncultured Acetatifactor sp.]
MIRNIVFDIGNVLTDFRWKGFLRDKGFDEDMVERIAEASIMSPCWEEFDRGDWDEERLLQEFIKNDPEIEQELRSSFSCVTGMVTIRDYAIPWIKELKEKGYRVLYLSNFSYKAYVECAEALTFLPYMDGGILSYREKLVKPNPEIYRLLLDRFSLLPRETVFLDDTLKNVEAAREQGIYGIHFESREQACLALKELGVM